VQANLLWAKELSGNAVVYHAGVPSVRIVSNFICNPMQGWILNFESTHRLGK